jgi:signal peptidase II
MTLSRRAFYGVAALVVLLDQVTKAWLRATLPLGESVRLWPDVFHLTHTQNRGAAFSLLEGRTSWLAFAALVVVGVIIYAVESRGTRARLPVSFALALALPLGGAMGNFVDRVRLGYVTDMFDAVVINFPVFNVADSAITVGIAVLLWRTLVSKDEGQIVAVSNGGDRGGVPVAAAPEDAPTA